jgi:hypothetical protein
MPVIDSLARLSPRTTPPESFGGLEPFLPHRPARIAAAADAVGALVAGCFLPLVAVTGRPGLLVGALAAGTVAAGLVRGGAVAFANARRSRVLGLAPAVVSRAVLRMRIVPTAEEAAAFAAETEGLLGKRLAEHVRRARGTPRSGLGEFAAAWREPFPAFHRALTLVGAAADAPAGERDRTLDRAMDAVLEGTRERATEAAESLRGPATAVYAFGVLLPLALVGVLPAAGAAGIEATLPVIVAVYDVLLPAGLLCAGGWLLARRPVVFPTEAADQRDGRDSPWTSVLGVVAAGCCWLAAGTALPPWSRPVAAVGVGTGASLLVRYRPVVADRRRADRLEAALPDALYLVGRRVSDGIAVERAVAETADELDGVAATVFTAAARRQRQLRVGVEAAFTGEYGALESVSSRRAESAARLLGVAARTGPPAGRALVETADHLDDLRQVEGRSRRELGQVTSTLANTAAFFGPLVGGATVGLADSVGTADVLEASVPGTAGIGLAIGGYVLFLAVSLTALSSGLARGFDRATVGYRAGAALCVATTTYLLAFYLAATAAGGL